MSTFGYRFDSKVVKTFKKAFKLSIFRAHQVVMDGFEFFADRKLVTVFSVSFLDLKHTIFILGTVLLSAILQQSRPFAS